MGKAKQNNRIVVAMMGARRHYAVPKSFHDIGALEHFYTDICGISGWPRVLNYIPKSVQPGVVKRLTGRVPNGLPDRKLTSFPDFGLSYALKLSQAKSVDEKIRTFKWAGDRFASKVKEHGFGDADTLYAFNHNGARLLKEAKRQGLRTILDVTGPPLSVEQKLLEEERELYPDWESEENIPDEESVRFLDDMDRRSWKYADALICGSEYTRHCIVESGGPEEKCFVTPYGLTGCLPDSTEKKEYFSRLRVLTVGAVSLRKGAPYVLEAARRLKNHAVFRMVGSIDVLPDARDKMARHINLMGASPRSEVSRHFEWADVFLLPSLSEGSAAVTYEALAYGLPVICTPNTGSIIRDGIEGYIVNIRDVEAITERLMQLYSSLSRREEMSDMARQRAIKFTSEDYGRRLLEIVKKSVA